MTGDSFARQGRLFLTALPTGTKVLLTVCWAVTTSAWAALLSLDISSPPHTPAVAFALALLGVGAVGPMTIGSIEAFRFAAWLEGTTLVVQHALWVARCDLARSQVRLGRWGGLPLLRARDGVTGRRVWLVLGHSRGRAVFEPQKLIAVADAIVAGRHADPRACQAAAAVWALAAPAQDGTGAFW
jgi:hypothetical protein